MKAEEDDKSNNDLSKLPFLDEHVILHNLKSRFERGSHYTSLGDVLVAVNPYRPLSIYGHQYHIQYETGHHTNDPHVFWVAQNAYCQLMDTDRNQCILVSGESGAGKTETTKHIVSHMSFISCTRTVSLVDSVGDVREKIVHVNPLLEAFGNASTLMNENSSRFGKYLELFFTGDGTLNGAKVFAYILEKSRVVSRGAWEKNFHVFYYMLAGLTHHEQKQLYLDQPDTFRILQGHSPLPDWDGTARRDYTEHFHSLLELMHGVGFTDTDVTTMMTILAGILHLTNIQFEADDDTDGVHIADEFPLLVGSSLLALDIQCLTTSLISNTVFLRGEKVVSLKKKMAADDGRDSLAKALYDRLFNWVVAKINYHLQGDDQSERCDRSIGILDMSGFEKFPHNGFEQLCINAANERLQQFFNEAIFLMEATDYQREGVNMEGIIFRDNQQVIDLLFKRPYSVFDVMDEESIFPQATDKSFVRKLTTTFHTARHFRSSEGSTDCFTIIHYAGEVHYDGEGMLERNRDRLGSNLLECLTGSTDHNISALIKGNVHLHDSSSRRLNVARVTHTGSSRSWSKSTALRLLANGNRRPALHTDLQQSSFASKQFRKSLDKLVAKLSDSKPWFIKCIKPNNNRSPVQFKEGMVMEQLRCNGLLEVAKQRRDGYAVRMLSQEFVERFRDISFPPSDVVNLSLENIERILKDAGIQDYVIGETKVFLRHWQEPYLRDLTSAIVQERIQAEAAMKLSPSEHSSVVNGESSVRTTPDRELPSELVYGVGEDEEQEELPDKPNSSYRISEWMAAQYRSSNSPPTYDPCKPSLSEQQIRDANEKKILDPRWWDRFQMMPREHVSGTSPFLTLFKVFKVICYIFLFVLVMSAAVINKVCILVMTSSVIKDPLPEADWPMRTMLIISMCVPYGFWFIVYGAKTLFGSSTWPSFSLLSMVLVLELLHTFGLCLLVFRVLPLLDMFRAVIVLSSIYTVPAFLKTIFECKDTNTKAARRLSSFILNTGAFVIQVGSIVACCFFDVTMTSKQKTSLHKSIMATNVEKVIPRPELGSDHSEYFPWELPLSLFLISLSFWENYVDGDFTIFGHTFNFSAWKKHLHHSRARLYIFASVWKAVWIVIFAVLLQSGMSFNLSFSDKVEGQQLNGSHLNSVVRMRRDLHPTENVTKTIHQLTTVVSDADATAGDSVPFYMAPETVRHFEKYGILYIQILANTLLTYFGSIACKLCMQIVGFSFPLILVTPVSAAVVILQCYFKFLPTGIFVWIGVEENSDIWILHIAWLGILWLSGLFITSHIWYPNNGRLENLDKLFVMPLRCAILSDESLTLRRRRNDHDTSLNADDDTSVYPECDAYKADDIVPQIYACATMWHETRAEMTNLLKSIFRMDIDHSGRFLAQKFYKIRDPDYYEFEAHIFFDDAMELSDDDRLVPNMFVADLMDCIDDSLSSVHERQMALGPPVRSPTPYGGRLTWTLPGGTRLVAHLKDKHKIRHKKRWSQVMYMYYLLGYRILAQSDNKTVLEEEQMAGEFQRVKLTDAQLRKRRKAAHFTRSVIFNYVTDDVHTTAENTYILTLDGDVDFHPDAVRLLVDRLKTNKKVGAACGRIHPIGSGPLLWYQQFEYAIGHWLQKATEHVFGCVMCAPGCFSLFRGSALMDDNVARTYATRATEAGHYVQYDQGEDRWLSTLLLQQGYRIDYCAASDAFTHAPETFSEFFNQRRRWGPSTLANIIDLLGSWKETIKLNDNISTLYIIYQFCLMISTILGPATILLMMAGAYTIVFKTGIVTSYALSIIPAILFILICINQKPQTQMTIASIMSAIYAIVMTIVLVGTIGQAIEGGFTSPNVIFMFILIVIFFVSALLHPEEFFCVISGALYFICLPTGYLLLTIYFLCNLHVVSWGTREIPKRKTKEQIALEKQEEEERKVKKEQKKKGILGWMGFNTFFREMGDVLKQIRTDVSSGSGNKTDILLEELIHEIRASREPKLRPRSKSASTNTDDLLKQSVETKEDPSLIGTDTHTKSDIIAPSDDHLSVPVWLKREDNNNPAWLSTDICGIGTVRHLAEREVVFWNQLIARYLHPITEDKAHQEKVAFDLKNLRNNVVFGFFMTSALWIAVSMQLQILQEELKYDIFFHIPRWDSDDDLAFEPLGLIFLAFFATILLVQFVGMFIHRWGTVLHMLSITDISCGKTFTEKDKVKDIISKAMELQKLSNIENEPLPDYDEPLPDYMDSDDENIFDGASLAGDTVSLSMLSENPPSYHSSVPSVAYRRRQSRQGQDIFTRKGHSSGAALRKAFEKRFRNEKQGQVTVHVDPSQGSGQFTGEVIEVERSYDESSIA